jgi:Holliday junction resolvase
MNSRDKGAKGERELAGKLRDHGFMARRGQQFSGLNGDADVLGLPNIHIECKRVERLNLEDAMEQSKRDAREGEIATVMHRKNNHKWLVTMELTDWMQIYKESEYSEERRG